MKMSFKLSMMSLAVACCCHSALAQQTTKTVSERASWYWPVLIGVAISLVTQGVAHLFAQRFERQKKEATQAEVIRHYLAPLSDACEKIVWRLREVLVEKRHYWLMVASLPLDYNAYKRKSTIYRIATLLGWLRAIDVELSAASQKSPRGRGDTLVVIKQCLVDIRSVLADGTSVEIRRLERLCAVWQLDWRGLAPGDLGNLALRIGLDLHRLAGGDLRRNPDLLNALGAAKQLEICKGLCALICAKLGKPVPDDAALLAALARAMECLAFREAWIYRDWQDCIGDAVLEPETGTLRRFRIVGFEAFIAKLESGKADPEKPWYAVLDSLVTDVNFEQPNPNDIRAEQLKGLTSKVAQLLVAIRKREPDLVGPRLFTVAKSLI